jgi:uroporphyrinogen decarboxylase
MMETHEPDYTNLIEAAYNRRPSRVPLYEHNISVPVVEAITNTEIGPLLEGSAADKREYFRLYSDFCKRYGYDTVPYEAAFVDLVQGGEALSGRKGALFRNKTDLQQYPWDELPDRYFTMYGENFAALRETLPPGMKAVGGVGYGIFEATQDFIPLTDLAYLEMDAPEVFTAVWERVGTAMFRIWDRLLREYGEIFAVCRSGDDLGFKSSLLIKPETVREHIIPQYARIVDLVHQHGKPFLLHSCGRIYEIMNDLINTAGIDAKHSNEDEIDPFSDWVRRYGDRIGLFGGFDMNVLCLYTEQEIKSYVREVLSACGAGPGLAYGSGNQIADYVPPKGFIAMTEAVREWRGA